MDTGGAGSGGTAAAPDLRITSCDLREEVAPGSGTYWEWAEFDVVPGKTEITVCRKGVGDIGPQAEPWCSRYVPAWYEGTAIGYVMCGDVVTSITVHR